MTEVEIKKSYLAALHETVSGVDWMTIVMKNT